MSCDRPLGDVAITLTFPLRTSSALIPGGIAGNPSDSRPEFPPVPRHLIVPVAILLPRVYRPQNEFDYDRMYYGNRSFYDDQRIIV